MLELVVPQEPGVRQAQDAFRDLYYARLLPVLERVLDDMVPPDRFIRLERLELNLGSTGWDLDPEPLEAQLEFRLRQQMEQILNAAQVEETQPLGEFDSGDADWNLLLHYLVHGEVPEWLSPANFKADAQLLRMLRAADTKQIILLRKVMALPVVLLRVAWTMPEATRMLALERLLSGRTATVRQIHSDLARMHQRQPLLPMDASMFAYRLWESSLSMVTLLPETAVSAADILPIYLQSLLPQPIFRPRDRVWLLMRSIAAVPSGELAAETVQAVTEMAALAGMDTELPLVTHAKAMDLSDAEQITSKESGQVEANTSDSPADTSAVDELLQVETSQSSITSPLTSQVEGPSAPDTATPKVEAQPPKVEKGESEQPDLHQSVEPAISEESPVSLVSESAESAEGQEPRSLLESQTQEVSLEPQHLPESVDVKDGSNLPSTFEVPTTDPDGSLEAKKEIEASEIQTVLGTQEQQGEELPHEDNPLKAKVQVPDMEGSEPAKELPKTPEGESADTKAVETPPSPESGKMPVEEATESIESIKIDPPTVEESSSQQLPPEISLIDSELEEIKASKAAEPSSESQKQDRKPTEDASESQKPIHKIAEESPETEQPIQSTTEESPDTRQPFQKTAAESSQRPIDKEAPRVEVNPESGETPDVIEQPQDAPEALLRSAEEESIADRFRRFREQWAQNPESLIPRTQTEPLHIPWRQNDPKHGMGVLYAGLVIAWPYIGPLFKRLEWLEKREFVSPEAQFAAVHLLRYVATGTLGEVQDHELGFCKVMAGLHPTDPVPTEMPLTEAQCAAADEMVDAVIANWGAVKRTSRAGLRQTFLQRAGNIRSDENGWIVHLERETMDILLDRIPWGYSTIRLGWQSRMIFVQW